MDNSGLEQVNNHFYTALCELQILFFLRRKSQSVVPDSSLHGRALSSCVTMP